MDKVELYKQIELLEKDNTIDSCNQIIALIEEYSKSVIDETEQKELENKKIYIEIKIIKLKLEGLETNNYQEAINLRGKLIKLYKMLERKVITPKEKNQISYELIKELKKHKTTLKLYKKDKTIPISKRVGLGIMEISKTIEIFMKEKDVLVKAKNIVKDTISGTAGIVAVMATLGIIKQKLFGIPFTLSSLVLNAPIIAYVGLSSIIKNIMLKTPFEQYQYFQSDEYKASIEAFKIENKKLFEEIAQLTNEKSSIKYNEDIITINNELINKLDSLVNSTDIKALQETFQLQIMSFLRENKELCEKIRDEYLDGNSNDKENFSKYSSMLSKIKKEIFIRGNSIEEAFKFAGKNIAVSTKVIVLTKVLLSIIGPEHFPINGIKSFITPICFAIINGIIDIPTYQNKLKFKETEYEGKVKTKDMERIKNMLSAKKKQPKLA